ncbi:hypothetical protein AGMMS4956_19850 [Bacteroidia bacterium]|nr:hypothetical protein AGMMS4956_19850 [Bacteroidia bacterium]
MDIEDIHIGRAIQQKMAEQGCTVAQMAKEVHCDRSNIYDIFKRKSIDMMQLIRISQVLHYDFYAHLYSPTQKHILLIETDAPTMQQIVSNSAVQVIYSL